MTRLLESTLHLKVLLNAMQKLLMKLKTMERTSKIIKIFEYFSEQFKKNLVWFGWRLKNVQQLYESSLELLSHVLFRPNYILYRAYLVKVNNSRVHSHRNIHWKHEASSTGCIIRDSRVLFLSLLPDTCPYSNFCSFKNRVFHTELHMCQIRISFIPFVGFEMVLMNFEVFCDKKNRKYSKLNFSVRKKKSNELITKEDKHIEGGLI